MPRLSFDERIHSAGQITILARRFYDVWWLYEGEETRPTIIDQMNCFPEFFRFDIHAHFVALIMHLAILFERREDTVNFGALIAEAESENLIPSQVLAEASKQLASVLFLCSKLAILRSNLFSHRSGSMSYDGTFDKAAITPFQLRDLTDAGLFIANILLVARGQQECFFSETTLDDAKGMLRAIQDSSCGGLTMPD